MHASLNHGPELAAWTQTPSHLLRVLGEDSIEGKHLGHQGGGSTSGPRTAWWPSSWIIEGHLLLSRVHLQERHGLGRALDRPDPHHDLHLGRQEGQLLKMERGARTVGQASAWGSPPQECKHCAPAPGQSGSWMRSTKQAEHELARGKPGRAGPVRTGQGRAGPRTEGVEGRPGGTLPALGLGVLHTPLNGMQSGLSREPTPESQKV